MLLRRNIYFADIPFVHILNQVQRTTFNFYHVTKPFGPAGLFSKVYLPIEKVVEREAERTVPFGSLNLFSLTQLKILITTLIRKRNSYKAAINILSQTLSWFTMTQRKS